MKLLEIRLVFLMIFMATGAEGMDLVIKGILENCFLVFFLSSNERSQNLTLSVKWLIYVEE